MMLSVAVACAACTRTRCTTTRRGAHARRRPHRCSQSSTRSTRLRFTARRRCCSLPHGAVPGRRASPPLQLPLRRRCWAARQRAVRPRLRKRRPGVQGLLHLATTSLTRRTCAHGSSRSGSARLARSWRRLESLSHFELHLLPRWPPTWGPRAGLPLWRCNLLLLVQAAH